MHFVYLLIFIIGFWNFNLQERQISNRFHLPRSRVLASISVIPFQNSNFLISFQREFRSKSCLNHDLFIIDTNNKGLLQAHTQGSYCYSLGCSTYCHNKKNYLTNCLQQKNYLTRDNLSYGRRASFSLVSLSSLLPVVVVILVAAEQYLTICNLYLTKQVLFLYCVMPPILPF